MCVAERDKAIICVKTEEDVCVCCEERESDNLRKERIRKSSTAVVILLPPAPASTITDERTTFNIYNNDCTYHFLHINITEVHS